MRAPCSGDGCAVARPSSTATRAPSAVVAVARGGGGLCRVLRGGLRGAGRLYLALERIDARDGAADHGVRGRQRRDAPLERCDPRLGIGRRGRGAQAPVDPHCPGQGDEREKHGQRRGDAAPRARRRHGGGRRRRGGRRRYCGGRRRRRRIRRRTLLREPVDGHEQGILVGMIGGDA
jgi:hypothetical protein